MSCAIELHGPDEQQHYDARWCSSCSRWRFVEPRESACRFCDDALGVTLRAGMMVKTWRKRYPRGVYGPLPTRWIAGRVVGMRDTYDGCELTLETTRYGEVLVHDDSVVPMGVMRGRLTLFSH